MLLMSQSSLSQFRTTKVRIKRKIKEKNKMKIKMKIKKKVKMRKPGILMPSLTMPRSNISKTKMVMMEKKPRLKKLKPKLKRLKMVESRTL